MTVVDVNTGKFTGSGGNLEETVTKNNLEAAEEMVRQLRLRDIGGIIVIDFIDMVLESNRDLVLRRLVECLGRDRTRHQVAEVTSLGLVQMTRKRIGTGLVEAFSTDCEACKGRGLVVHEHPVEPGTGPDDGDDSRGRGGRNRGGRNRGGRSGDSGGNNGGNGNGNGNGGGNGGGNGSGNGGGVAVKPSPADLAKMRPPEKHADDENATEDSAAVETPAEVTASGQGADETVADSTPEKAAQKAPEEAAEKTAEKTAEAAADQAPEQTGQDTAQEEAPVQETATVAEEPTEQNVIGRPTPSVPEPQHVPSESAADEPVAEPVAPRVVTTTRRRTARRPAGPPSPLADSATSGGAGRASAPSAEPVDIPVEPGSPPEPVAEPDPAVEEQDGLHADPTWPADEASDAEGSAGTDAVGDDEGDDGEETEDGVDEAGNAFSLSHVPVKRKGSRKR
jgi:ribonuclease E